MSSKPSKKRERLGWLDSLLIALMTLAIASYLFRALMEAREVRTPQWKFPAESGR